MTIIRYECIYIYEMNSLMYIEESYDVDGYSLYLLNNGGETIHNNRMEDNWQYSHNMGSNICFNFDTMRDERRQ